MNYEQLKILIALADSATILEVANSLHISHSSISRTISSLEKTLGFTLFNRTRKGIELTEQGAHAVGIAREIVVLYDNMMALGEDSGTEDPLRIGYSTAGLVDFLSRTILEFKTLLPNVVLRMEHNRVSQIMCEVTRHSIDIGLSFITYPELQKISGELNYETLFRTRLVALMHPDSVFADREKITISELTEQLFALPDDSVALAGLDHVIGLDKIKPYSYFSQGYMIRECVMSGKAFAFDFEAIVMGDPFMKSEGLTYVPIEFDGMDNEIYYICYYLAGKKLSSVQTQFLKLLRANIEHT